MKKTKIMRLLGFVLAIALVFAPMQSAFAGLIEDGTGGPYKLIVHNQLVVDGTVNPIVTKPVIGAVYEVRRISTIGDDGSQQDLAQAVVLGQFTIEEGVENGFTTDVKGLYEIVPITRAPGYLLGESFIVEFPRMEDGVVAENQTIEVYPKVVELLSHVDLVKCSTDELVPPPDNDVRAYSRPSCISNIGENPLVGVVFELYQLTAIPDDPNIDPNVPIKTDLTTNDEGEITIENLSEGTYKICETQAPEGYGPVGKCTEFSVTAEEDATSNPAARIPIKYYNYLLPVVSKTVAEKAHAVGEDFDFTITVPIPANILDFDYYRLVDTYPSQITYTGHSISPTDLTASEIHDEANRTLTIEFDITKLFNAYAADPSVREIAVTFTGYLNNTAEAGVEYINKARLEWDDKTDPIDNPPGSSEDEEPVEVQEAGFTIMKTESNGTTALAGAEFQLFTDAEATVPFISPVTGEEVIATTNTEGIAEFNRLPHGIYYVKEVKAPEGYRLSEVITEVVVPSDDGTPIRIEIRNYRIDERLPATGTAGVIAFIVGGLAVLGTGAAFAFKSKKDEKDSK